MSATSTMVWPEVPASSALPPLPPRSPAQGSPSSAPPPPPTSSASAEAGVAPSPDANAAADAATGDIAWHRSSTDPSPAASTSATANATSDSKPSKPSLLTRAKTICCKLPNPTLFFALEVCVILCLHLIKPHLLRTWAARIVTPLFLIPTIFATALWRPTIIVPASSASSSSAQGSQQQELSTKDVLNPYKPIPNAASIVKRGENLRVLEASVAEKERLLAEGTRQLEQDRIDIQQKLPPASTISNMLASEAKEASSSSGP